MPPPPPATSRAALRAATVRTGRWIVFAGLLLAAALAAWRKTAHTSTLQHLVLFFEDSVNGLGTGSPVKTHGITIGQVEAVGIRLPAAPGGKFYAEVRVALDNHAMEALGLLGDLSTPAHLQGEIKKGLRGKFVLISPMTGEYGIELAHAPEVPPVLATAEPEALAEIPVIPNMISGEKLDTFSDTLAAFSQRDFPALEREWNAALDAALALAEPERVRFFSNELLARLQKAGELLRDPHVRDDLRTLNESLLRLRTSIDASDADAHKAVSTLSADMASVRESLSAINVRLAEFGALLEVGSVSGPVRDFLDFLQSTRETALDIKRGATEITPQR
jgi:hypothetical protein